VTKIDVKGLSENEIIDAISIASKDELEVLGAGLLEMKILKYRREIAET
jgi:hypothetical protein